MTDVTSRYLPPPTDWQAFERLCFDLYRSVWQTDDAHLHGRKGQKQGGIDVYGTDRRSGKRVGVQCKGKDRDFGGHVTERELKREVAAARTFQPPIDFFVLATTAPNDKTIQAVARALTEEHLRDGLFEVHVVGWEELRQLIYEHPQIIEVHFADLSPTLPGLLRDAIESEGLQTRQVLIAEIARRLPTQTDFVAVPAPGAEAVDELGIRITTLASLLGEAAPAAVVKRLQALWTESAASTSDWNRYRIQANIAAAHWYCGDYVAAAAAYRIAYGEQRDTGAGIAALATAEMIEGDAPAAFAHAEESLALDPTGDRAASLLVQAAARPWTEVEAMLPNAHRNRAEIQIGLADLAQGQGDLEAADRLIEAALRRAESDWRILGRAGTLLFERVGTARPEVRFLRNAEDDERVLLERAVDLLGRSWDLAKESGWPPKAGWVVATLANAGFALGRDAEIDTLLRHACDLCPDSLPVLRARAVRAAERGDGPEAAACVRAIPVEQREDGDEVVLCQALLWSGTPQDALACAHTLSERTNEASLVEVAAALRFAACQPAPDRDP